MIFWLLGHYHVKYTEWWEMNRIWCVTKSTSLKPGEHTSNKGMVQLPDMHVFIQGNKGKNVEMTWM